MEPNSGSPINRHLQHELLLILRDEYPCRVVEFPQPWDRDQNKIARNLLYLEEHGLCLAGVVLSADNRLSFGGASITAKGLDFLEDDGGLTAILGVVTIKFHADMLREILVSKIDGSPLAPEEKSRLKEVVSQLGEAGQKAAITDLIHQGLQHIPSIVDWLRSIV
jgi:hypothetical protein